jgi:DNA-binding transcriptional MerR regulator
VDAEMTIEELAHRAGVKTTTVRLYQTRGLLPGPRLDGRVGWYGPAHLTRLELIGRLQERGFSLAAIQELVESWENGRGIDDLLGLERRLPGLLGAGEPLVVDAGVLAERLPPDALNPEAMARAARLGLLRPTDDGRMVLDDPSVLDVGPAVVALGIPSDEVLDEYEHLMKVMDEVAARFAGMFRRHIWQQFLDEGMPSERIPEVTDALERLAGLSLQAVEGALRTALRNTATQFMADEVGREITEDAGAKRSDQPR